MEMWSQWCPAKYLGCVIDEHLELKEMVEEKAAAGSRELSAWLNI